MTDKQKPKIRPEVVKAQDSFQKACIAYEKIVKHPRAKLKADEILKLQEAAKEALAYKRHCRVVLDAVKRGQQPPQAGQLPETAAIKDKNEKKQQE